MADIDPAVPEVAAALDAFGVVDLGNESIRRTIARFVVRVVRDYDSRPDLDAIRAGFAEFDEALADAQRFLDGADVQQILGGAT